MWCGVQAVVRARRMLSLVNKKNTEKEKMNGHLLRLLDKTFTLCPFIVDK
jgi:hypothetical protein